MNNKNIKSVIRTNPITHEIDPPAVLLKRERGRSVIGKIKYAGLEMNLSGTAHDEVSFKVYKHMDGRKTAVWASLVSGRVIEVSGYGQFEIDVTKETDSGGNIFKNVHGISLECELNHAKLYDIHCNDDYYFDYMAEDNMDSYGNIIPVTLWNPGDKKHSLLHLILEKAPAWSFARVPSYITVVQDGEYTKELSSSFQRTFTFDNVSIYDALTDDTASESSLVFTFDTVNRFIYAYDKFEEIGGDTNVFINTRNLAEKITIQDNKDALVNTMRVTGGDDVINNYTAAINITGTNYISMYSESMYEDMPEGLVSTLRSYQQHKAGIKDDYYGGYDVFNSLTESGRETGTSLIFDGAVPSFSSLPPASGRTGHYYYTSDRGGYYVSNGSSWVTCGAFVRLCSVYDQINYLEHSMMPGVSLQNTTASAQMGRLENALRNTKVSVSNLSLFTPSSFTGVTNQVTAYCKVILDNRYTAELSEDILNNYPRYNNGFWTGRIRVYRTADKTDTSEAVITVQIDDDAVNFAKQKIQKALAKDSMTGTESDILAYKTSADYGKLVSYFQKYCLERLKSFYDAYEGCLSVLMSLKSSHDSSPAEELYTMYRLRRDAVFQVYNERQKQIEVQKALAVRFEDEKSKIQMRADLKTFLDNIDASYWKTLNSYRRECDYSNNNYVSDGLESDGQILAKCKELLDTAEYELSMACQLQRTLSIDLADLLVMPEFEPFWDKFSLYNYIRVETDNEVLKLRLSGVNINFDSIEKLTVTFTDNISGNGNILNDGMMDAIKQVSSIGPSFSYFQKQASQGQKGYNQVAEWMDKGLKAAKTTISNSDNNEVTFNNYGINLKDMTEEGNYGDWQIRHIGQGIYFTNDNWKTVYAALGSIYIDGVRTTGLIAKNLIGELIAGQRLYITNEKGSFLLDKDSAKFTDITIDYSDRNGNRVKIGGASDRIFSISHNGNEVLYFNNVSNKMVMTGTLDGCDGRFSGTLSACSIYGSTVSGGIITGSEINGNKIIGGTITGSEINGNKIIGGTVSGTSISASILNGSSIIGGSIKIGDNFSVGADGRLYSAEGVFKGSVYADGGYFKGSVYADSGYFRGDITGCSGIFSGTLSAGMSISAPRITGGTIYGTSINVNDRFKVNSFGDVTLPPSATLSWEQITGTENVADKNEIPTTAQITKITQDTVTTTYVNALNITAGSVRAENITGSTITGKNIQAKGFSIWNTWTNGYENFIAPKHKVSWIYDNSVYSRPYPSVSLCADILGTDIYRDAYGKACIDTNTLNVDNIYIPFTYGTSEGTSGRRVYYMNGTVGNDGIPSAGWVKKYCRTGNMYVNYRRANNGEYLIKFGEYKPDAEHLEAATPGYVQTYVQAHSGTPSDTRLKRCICDMQDITSDFMKLRPVSYRFKNGLYRHKPDNTEFGFEADKVADLFPCDKYSIAWKASKIPDEEKLYCPDYAWRVDYKSIAVMTVQMVQKHQRSLESMEQNRNRIEDRLLALQGENAVLKQKIKQLEEFIYAEN